MKSITLLAIVLSSLACTAQKQSFDILSYIMPKGWDKIVTPNGIQLSSKNDGKGNYAAAVIVKSIPSNGTPQENFKSSWDNLVKGTVKVSEEPSMSDMDIENGWTCITGQANYTDGAAKGLVTLITATGNDKMANVVIMTNTGKYQQEVLAFVNSLEITEKVSSANPSAPKSNAANAALVGKIWEGTSLEKTGSGNMQMNTGGFFTDQYRFFANGTYRFVNVNASFFTDTKSLKYETGTYIVNEDQITIIPDKGANEEWTFIGKPSNGNSDMGNRKILETWGNKLKDSKRNLEKYTYTFSIGENGNKTALIMRRKGKTEREGLGEIEYLNETPAENSVVLPKEFK